MTFDTLGLAPDLLKAVADQGYTSPTPIQAQGIPAVLNGSDVMAAAQTGTGKTAGFTLPLLQRLDESRPERSTHPRALILTPTRELAAQVQDSVATYGKNSKLRSLVVFGGVNINPQIDRLRRGIDILVATPGRLLDLHQQKAVHLDKVEIFVLDEADRMLDMGFIHDIRRVLKLLPAKRQNLMFSATFSGEIRTLARGILNNPVEISVTPNKPAAETVNQQLVVADKQAKPALLTHLIKSHNIYQALVFSRTKHGANKLVKHLDKHGIPAAAIHGNKSQNHRTRVLSQFKKGELQILVATDIAARGIDIDQLPHVINFDLPQVAEDYVHRIGRTGRAGAEGEALSLVCAEEAYMLRTIERLMGKSIPHLQVEGFEATEQLPANPKPMKQGGGQNRGRGNSERSGQQRRSSTGNGRGNSGGRRAQGR